MRNQEKWGDPPETCPAARGLAAGPSGRPGEREASLCSPGRLELLPPAVTRGAAERWPFRARQSHVGHSEVLLATCRSAAVCFAALPLNPAFKCRAVHFFSHFYPEMCCNCATGEGREGKVEGRLREARGGN